MTGIVIGNEANKGKSLFENIDCRKEDYPYVDIQSDEGNLIVQNISYYTETGCVKWLALNPDIGRELGWTFTSEGLFQWRDDDGNILAESLWWTDGLI
jgi:hypothetical protein